MREAREKASSSRFRACCLLLEQVGKTLGARPTRAHARNRVNDREKKLASDLALAGIELDPESVIAAARTVSSLLALGLLGASALIFLFVAVGYLIPMMLVSLAVPALSREVILAYPSSAAKKRAAEVLKSSTHSANLMIMSLRHEPSISKAMRFASNRETAFGQELRGCIWGVVMGKYSSFEESLHALGTRWARFGGDLIASLNAMVTASCEATHDGRRRALDRANNSMISGAKRRIEEYALSLSTPSMIMFGLGILLPLMVGSFLPMLSWNLWSLDAAERGALMVEQGGTAVEIVFIMNVLFPAVALMVALNAISRHPLENAGGPAVEARRTSLRSILAALSGTIAGCTCALLWLDGMWQSVAILLSAVCPGAAWLSVAGARMIRSTAALDTPGVEDVLFKTGARMLEGENFEAALARANLDLEGESAETIRRISFRSSIAGQDFDFAAGAESGSPRNSNSFEGLRVVKESATKDEHAAGILAMDLAAYLKDLHDLETTLKNRLRPTISMMKMTTHALGPIVLGVTYAIYLSIASIVENGQGSLGSGLFFVVLGLFLAETDLVVGYFIWGIEGDRGRGHLMYSLGTCILLSESIFVSTALVASQ